MFVFEGTYILELVFFHSKSKVAIKSDYLDMCNSDML